MSIARYTLFLLGGALLLGCSDDAPADGRADANGEADAGGDGAEEAGGQDQTTGDASEDVITIGEVGIPDEGTDAAGCEPGVVAEAWPWNDEVTTGSVEVTPDGDVFHATIDASAGGMEGSYENPFVYLDLDSGERVDISDVQALEDTTWDLAFKRVLIRTNSADSGPGQISLARLADTTFDEVTTAPTADSAYRTDVSLDENCEVLTDPIGNPIAAINYLNTENPSGSMSWYNYDGGVSPNAGDIYIVRDGATATTYKLEILSWSSGVFEIQWAEL